MEDKKAALLVVLLVAALVGGVVVYANMNPQVTQGDVDTMRRAAEKMDCVDLRMTLAQGFAQTKKRYWIRHGTKFTRTNWVALKQLTEERCNPKFDLF